MMKQRTRKMHFLLLFFEHQYLTYNNRLTSEVFYTYSRHSDLVNCVSDFFFVGLSFYLIKSRKIILKNHKSFPFFVTK